MLAMTIDEIRETRINTEILADAEDKEERAMGWYYYLDDCLNVPFMGKWKKKNRKTGAIEEKPVEVLGMSGEDDCLKDMYVDVAYLTGKEDDIHSAKLSEIEATDADEETQEALADWQYWLSRGYKF
ncbi:MAG: calcium-binding protein [Nostocales cyanobacterium ELA608]|nr:calcium-binding protein [Nostocales cyanobacterium W4_Combined_metabat2_030]